jgi:hypothetical protein
MSSQFDIMNSGTDKLLPNLSDAESQDLEDLLTQYKDICYEKRWLRTDRQSVPPYRYGRDPTDHQPPRKFPW